MKNTLSLFKNFLLAGIVLAFLTAGKVIRQHYLIPYNLQALLSFLASLKKKHRFLISQRSLRLKYKIS
ncbi:hypothetical protein CLV94_0314 [Flavobacterium endophyticum]|uniref:Uncharacterized protein n=1 Tax=Flavobacterium endophyticum TaxID=1540163 RepID=A0A495MH41_9FLAO|nr:hypothetical protein CLV94_0314 [Flavobacterium endophyticum]